MNTAEYVFSVSYFTLNKGNMVFSVEFVYISVCNKVAVFCRHLSLCHTLYKLVIYFSVLLESFNCNYFHIEFFGKSEKFCSSHHCSVVSHNFTAETAFLKACKSHKVYGCFCMSVSFQNTVFLGKKREHMSGTAEILRSCVIVDTFHCCYGTFSG